MSRTNKDPLLAAAQVILALAVVLTIFLMAMMLIGLGAILTVGRGEVAAKLAEAAAPASAYWAIVASLALLLALFYVGMRFFLALGEIVRSVERGDPFEPANAGRLSQMGWLTVAAYALAALIGGLAAWVKSVSGEAGRSLDVDVDLGGGGIVLILTLFILARVFRKGTEMREELEGTV